MRSVTDEQGRTWIATATEEQTPRHHGRWYMVFRGEDGSPELPLPEARWQTHESADRTIATMSEFDLRQRLRSAIDRALPRTGATA